MTKVRNASNQARTILLVEDDAALRTLVARHLRGQGFQVREAEEAEDVLTAEPGEERSFDLVLTDVHLPGLSGVELARFLLVRSPLQPVVLITGDADESLAREALAHGAASYLLKPFELFELDAAVGQALSRVELVEATAALARADAEHLPDRGAGGAALPESWLRLSDERSGANAGHGHRVARISHAIAAVLVGGLSAAERRSLELAARAHEIGRLLDPAPSPAELARRGARATMVGAAPSPPDLATRSAQLLATLGLDPEAVRVVRHMHETWTGTGGPNRLAGTEIPQASLILAVADAVDHHAAAAAETGGPAAENAINAVLGRGEEAYGPVVCRALHQARGAVVTIWSLAAVEAGA